MLWGGYGWVFSGFGGPDGSDAPYYLNRRYTNITDCS